MSLPSDNARQLANIQRKGVVAAVDVSSKPPLVRVEIDEGVISDWMPFSQPFIGETRILCAPKVGTVGWLQSEAGENEINIFTPCFLDDSNSPDFTDDDFMIIFKNGDSIKHDASEGDLTINITGKLKINAKNIDITAEELTKFTSKTFQSDSDDATTFKAGGQATFESSTIAVLKSPQNFSDAPITYLAGGLSQGTPPPAQTSRMARMIDYSIKLLGKMFVQDVDAKGYIKAENDITSDTNMIINTLEGKIKLKEHTHPVDGDATGEPKKS